MYVKNLKNPTNQEFLGVSYTYRVSQKTWEFGDEFDIVFLNNS